MNSFININFNISEIKFVFYISPGKGIKNIQNRKSYGFIYTCGEYRNYIFDNEKKLETKKGDVVFIPKNSSYTIDSKTTGDCYILNFDFCFEPDIEPLCISPKNTSELLKHFENAENMWKSRRTGYYEKCFAELYSIIYAIKKELTTQYTPKSREALIKPAIKYIDENFTEENINISHLADLCGISEQYLRQIFHNVYGISPIKYINSLKISRAKELIRYGSYSVHEAAALSGFFNDSYFSREFKKSTGLSPTEYFSENNR